MNIETTPAGDRPGGASTPPGFGRVPPGPLAWLPWLAAAGFALLAGFLGQEYFAAKSEIVALGAQNSLANLETRGLQNQLEAERILNAQFLAEFSSGKNGPADLGRFQFLLMQSSNARSGSAMMVWDPDRQEGLLVMSDVPAPAPDREYRLWIVDSRRPAPVAGGLLTIPQAAGEARVSFRLNELVSAAAKVFVSVEPKGGTSGATGPVLLSSQ
jgi:hypothetical protein